MSEKFCRNRAEWEQICQKKSHPGSANAHMRTLADHVLGLDVFRAALWREVNDDALTLDLPGDLPFLPVLVGAADEGLASVDCDLARAAGMGRVLGSVFKKLGLKEKGGEGGHFRRLPSYHHLGHLQTLICFASSPVSEHVSKKYSFVNVLQAL